MAVQQRIESDIRPLSDFEFDEFETGILAVARYFLIAMNAPETMAWQKAFIVSRERWGETIGFPAAFLLSKSITALFQLRKSGFQFQDPLCIEAREYVTDDEVVFLEMVHHMRRDNTPIARLAVEELTLGRMDPDIIRTALAFAARFSCGTQAQSDSQARPSLSVVQ
ncbi:MAG: hypothetical protein AAGA08_01015 [Pseudomonadota bacterium]